ncbi:methionine ABC transporter permease [Clostridium frigidicarnis]|uniref:D-methionine transport system permease protein n=1 Tax=Clostridium frigidicarnis TaxID=84698 RepID=A0A1I1A301_9CLOT|nr:methionine ABC transporter permease [Clostridium frigidicarnis]SFB32341.1 D-methionine transport system permease protein [Clostridium frigidicarnis]
MINFFTAFQNLIYPELLNTLNMVIQSTIYSILLGVIPAIVLVVTSSDGLRPNKFIYSTLDFIVNTLRSFPFIILLVALLPLTRLLIGTTIGPTAAIIPLSIGAAPFTARVIETALLDIDKGVIDAAKSFGCSDFQIIFRIMFKEALPSIILGITLTVISIVGYSAMAGVIGGKGLGDLALQYGYYRFQTDILIYTVIVLIIVVQVFQTIGNLVYKLVNK